MNQFLQWGIDVQRGMGIDPAYHNLCATLAVSAAAIAVAVAVYYICSRVVSPMVLRIAARTSIKWDDILLNPGMMKALSEVVPAIMLSMMLPGAVALYPEAVGWVTPIMSITVVIAVTNVANRILLAVYELICSHTTIPAQSLKGIRQMLQLIAIIVAFIIVVSILVGKSPVIILSGLGASAAVLMLVFKDSILGLVAGVQLTVNDMLHPGDWITAPRYGVNGVVQEVTLTTVKVQNFDMTIVTIPPYSLVSDAFQNWRGMQSSGGRRIMRSINIDANSVTFMTPGQLSRFSGQPWASRLDLSVRQVNLTVFRHYLEHYISTLASCVSTMTAMVRELQPTSEGIPVEIYFFTSLQEWVSYEHTQADVLDHVIAMVPGFGLRIYQSPSGLDLRAALAGK